jgi:microcystin-dependent protein
MSTIKSSDDHLTLNADGSSKNILFQADGVQKASISSAGLLTSTTIDATVLTGNLPAISGASLTGIEGVPTGVIVMWSGAVSAIPSGWVICDGNNSTPNLTGKFILHADADSGGTNDVGDTGGSSTTGAHTLTISEMPAHTHENDGGYGQAASGSYYNTVQPGNTGSTGGGGSHTHTATPPFYALAYIMKT